MKPKLFITGALVLALAMTPHTRARAQQKPQWVIPVVCGLVVIGVGAWVTYEIVEMCKKIPQAQPPDQPDPPPPPPNGAQFTPSSTNTPSVTMVLTDASGVLVWDASAYGWTDPVTGDPLTAIMVTRVQSTVDFRTWTDVVSLLGYCSPGGITMIYSQGGAPICTNYLANGATNILNLCPQVQAPRKFFRLAAP
jgi:hypothetical protein